MLYQNFEYFCKDYMCYPFLRLKTYVYFIIIIIIIIILK